MRASQSGPTDGFGVQELEPTIAGGREWYLPITADQADAEWYPETGTVTSLGGGVFQVTGAAGETRLSVRSPSGKSWWQNVEMTWYVQAVRTTTSTTDTLAPHYELFARGERHSDQPADFSDVNGGVLAPAGTPTWPGYPFPAGPVNPHCFGTAYHGFLGMDARVHIEKEVTHIEGYADEEDQGYATGLGDPTSHFVGMKILVRNASGGTSVTTELWVDVAGNGQWARYSVATDSGKWVAPGLDGCDDAPYGYKAEMVLTWAGPFVTFRADNLDFDFKWASAREIAPLP